MKSSHLCGVNTSFALIQQGWISKASRVSYSSMSATKTYPFQILPRLTHVQGKFHVKLSCQIGGTLTGLVHNLDNIQPLLQKESLGLQMVLGIASQTVVSPNRLPKGAFPSCQEVLNILQIAVALHGIGPPFFHPSLISTVQQKFPPFILRTARSGIPFVSDR